MTVAAVRFQYSLVPCQSPLTRGSESGSRQRFTVRRSWSSPLRRPLPAFEEIEQQPIVGAAGSRSLVEARFGPEELVVPVTTLLQEFAHRDVLTADAGGAGAGVLPGSVRGRHFPQVQAVKLAGLG